MEVGGRRNLNPCGVCFASFDKNKTRVFYKVYPGCCTTWRYFIGVLYCYIRDILIFLTCDCFGVSKYAWRASMRRIYMLGVERWSRVPLLKLLRICRLGRRGQVVPTVLITTFWPVCRRDRSLFPFFQHNIPSLISYFLLKNQPIIFEIMPPSSPDIFLNIFLSFLPLLGVFRVPHRTTGVLGVSQHSCDDSSYKTPYRHLTFLFSLLLLPQTMTSLYIYIFSHRIFIAWLVSNIFISFIHLYWWIYIYSYYIS